MMDKLLFGLACGLILSMLIDDFKAQKVNDGQEVVIYSSEVKCSMITGSKCEYIRIAAYIESK